MPATFAGLLRGGPVIGALRYEAQPYVFLVDELDKVADAFNVLCANLQRAYGDLQEINAQLDLNFYGNWQAFGALRRDLIAGEMLDTELGLGYQDECLAIALAYRRKYTSEPGLPPSTAVILHIGLKTGDAEGVVTAGNPAGMLQFP